MEQIAAWSAAVLSVIYGALTAWAGLAQVRLKKIQAWAAWSHAGFGLVTAAGGILTLLRSPYALWVLAIGLAGIHLLAINNGLKMFGRINPSHHLVRLLISLVLLGLAYISLR